LIEGNVNESIVVKVDILDMYVGDVNGRLSGSIGVNGDAVPEGVNGPILDSYFAGGRVSEHGDSSDEDTADIGIGLDCKTVQIQDDRTCDGGIDCDRIDRREAGQVTSQDV